MTASLEGEPIEDVGYQLIQTWKPGQKGKDNGVVLVIATGERRIRIETGKGVGGDLTDLQSNDIIRRRIAPLMRENRVHDAILAGVDGIAEALSGTGTTRRQPGQRPPDWQQAPVVLPHWFDLCFWGFILFVVVMLLLRASRHPRRRTYWGGPPWIGGGWVAGAEEEAAAGAGAVEAVTGAAASAAEAVARAAAAAPATATKKNEAPWGGESEPTAPRGPRTAGRLDLAPTPVQSACRSPRATLPGTTAPAGPGATRCTPTTVLHPGCCTAGCCTRAGLGGAEARRVQVEPPAPPLDLHPGHAHLPRHRAHVPVVRTQQLDELGPARDVRLAEWTHGDAGHRVRPRAPARCALPPEEWASSMRPWPASATPSASAFSSSRTLWGQLQRKSARAASPGDAEARRGAGTRQQHGDEQTHVGAAIAQRRQLDLETR